MSCLVLILVIGSWMAIGGDRIPTSGGGAAVAQLEVSPSSGLAPLQITANAASSEAGQGATITSYDFNFGDGSSTGPQAKATVKHTYKGAGTFAVTLTITDSAGRTDQATQDVAVAKRQVGDPTAKLRVRPRTGEAPLRITARASTSSAGKGAKITAYEFDFGDGTSTGPQPKATVKHTYTRSGTFPVTLTVTNSAGRTDQATQDVTVTVTEPPPSEPTAKLRVTPQSGEAPLLVTADGSASEAGKGAKIATYDFSFGDGTSSGPQADATVEHTYKSARTYTVTLTVTNSVGRTNKTTLAVMADEPPPIEPTAALTLSDGVVDPVEPDSPWFIRADGSGSKAGPGAIMSTYEFSFSDGFSTGAQKQAIVEHECEPGAYRVTLTVTNSAGQTDTFVGTINVR